jgi:3-phenylpropionate/trans-cinnamate dioxygenase ferredoxin subunit
MQWTKAAAINELHHGQTKTLFIDDMKILLINLNGSYYAIQDLCTHDGGDLSGGEIDGDEIVCPRHGARFCIKTGAVLTPPAYEDIEAFAVKVEDNAIWVGV